ncbi:hypothetical protein ACTXJR_07415 [Glutamicibacter ardleyensis]|uniref:hypothetical protein n=1 Tax=Glutamicibacter ardleyensis TaxID=225894 RepID=UPI003FD08CAF
MFEVIDREPVVQFDIPQDASKARIISSFSGSVTDRQFIFTVKRVGAQYADNQKFEELNWSSSLKSSFEYVQQIPVNTTFLGKSFSLEPGIETLEISCIEWKKPTGTAGVSVTSLALELFSKEWDFPVPFKQLMIPGRII